MKLTPHEKKILSLIENDPDIIIAKLELNQSEKDLEISEADLKPTASLSLCLLYTSPSPRD